MLFFLAFEHRHFIVQRTKLRYVYSIPALATNVSTTKPLPFRGVCTNGIHCSVFHFKGKISSVAFGFNLKRMLQKLRFTVTEINVVSKFALNGFSIAAFEGFGNTKHVFSISNLIGRERPFHAAVAGRQFPGKLFSVFTVNADLCRLRIIYDS